MTTATAPVAIGTWAIDPSHSSVEFVARHLVVSKVKGRFASFAGTLSIAQEPEASSVEATIDMASVDTHDTARDEHLRSADFFDVERFPTMTFRSTRVVLSSPDEGTVEGELTIKGVTRPVSLALEVNGASADPWGGERAGFSASTEINRRDFGLSFDMKLDSGGALVGEKIKINLEIEAIRQQ